MTRRAAEMLRVPPDVPLEFAKSLVAFLNTRGHDLRLVLDEDGIAIERK